MAFWNKKKSIVVDVNKPVTNPALKNAFKIFNLNKCEETLKKLTDVIKAAEFLVLVETERLKLSPDDINNSVMFEKGGIIKFLKTYDENRQRFLPIFTDWKEIDLWTKSRKGFFGWIMPISDVFSWVNNSNDTGLVINPCSDKWTMDKEQIAVFTKESK